MVKTGYITYMKVAVGLFLVLMALNLIDAGATMYGIHQGYAVEMNPVCIFFMNRGDVAFWLFKAALALPALLLVYSYTVPGIKWPLWTTVICYGILDVYHAVLYFKVA